MARLSRFRILNVDDKGYWTRLEAYIRERSEAEFSHGLCPECAKKLYPEYVKNKKQ